MSVYQSKELVSINISYSELVHTEGYKSIIIQYKQKTDLTITEMRTTAHQKTTSISVYQSKELVSINISYSELVHTEGYKSIIMYDRRNTTIILIIINKVMTYLTHLLHRKVAVFLRVT